MYVHRKPPSYWAEKAMEAEAMEQWYAAAGYWQKAANITIGHKRMRRYVDAVERCQRKAEGK